MDIAAFISELLAQHGVLIVPGFGTFTKARVDGYYSKEQQQFYPPTHQILFKGEYTDDNILAERIAQERQISVASANYFIEKFVSAILELASSGAAPFSTMGNFTTRRGTLVFNASEVNETDEQFYGLAPVKLRRNSSFKQQNTVAPPRLIDVPVVEPTETVTPVDPDTRVEVGANTEEVNEEEETNTRRVNIWLILALTIVLVGVSIIGVYLFKPKLFDPLKPTFKKYFPAKAPAKLSKADSIKNALQAEKDVGLKSVVPTGTAASAAEAIKKPDTLAKTDTFAVVAGTFRTAKFAKLEADKYAKEDFSTGFRRTADNKHFEVTIGTYFNNDSAKAALIKAKQKLKTQDITIHTYPFKK